VKNNLHAEDDYANFQEINRMQDMFGRASEEVTYWFTKWHQSYMEAVLLREENVRLRAEREAINAIHRPIGFSACLCGLHDCPTEQILHPEEMPHDQG
jgi:hypothetical protein